MSQRTCSSFMGGLILGSSRGGPDGTHPCPPERRGNAEADAGQGYRAGQGDWRPDRELKEKGRELLTQEGIDIGEPGEADS